MGVRSSAAAAQQQQQQQVAMNIHMHKVRAVESGRVVYFILSIVLSSLAVESILNGRCVVLFCVYQ